MEQPVTIFTNTNTTTSWRLTGRMLVEYGLSLRRHTKKEKNIWHLNLWWLQVGLKFNWIILKSDWKGPWIKSYSRVSRTTKKQTKATTWYQLKSACILQNKKTKGRLQPTLKDKQFEMFWAFRRVPKEVTPVTLDLSIFLVTHLGLIQLFTLLFS